MARSFGSIVQFPGVATPAGNPPLGSYLLYVKSSDGKLYLKDSTGAEALAVPAGSGGGGEPVIAVGTTAQYWRGDKTWQTLDKTAAGLANVDNTSDVNKPVSTAVSTALGGKESTVAVGTTAQYWRGDKTWQALDVSVVANAMGLTTQQTVTGLKLFQARLRAGFNANVVTTPLTPSAAEFELSSMSMITLGENAAGSANPALTFYRTAAGARTGVALRQLWASSAGPFRWQLGSSAAYGAETYTDLMTLDTTGLLTVASLALTNALTQAKTHASPDTDASAAALHHTIGTGQFQAAAGNHTHATYVDLTTAQTVNGIKTFGSPVVTPGVTAPAGGVLALRDNAGIQRVQVDALGLNVTAGGLFDNGARVHSDLNRSPAVSVRAATTAAITTSGIPANIDGVTNLVAGDLVLVKNQTAPGAANGVYAVAAGAWSRAVGLTTATQVAGSDVVTVQSGTVNGGMVFTTTFKASDTLDSTAMNWYQIYNSLDLSTRYVDLSTTQSIGGAKTFTAPITTPAVIGDPNGGGGLSLRDGGGVERAYLDMFGLNVTSGGVWDANSRVYSDQNRNGVVSVQAATTPAGGNITLSGTQTVDGVALFNGDLVLVKNQTAPATQGVYQVSSTGAWSRAPGLTTAPQVAAARIAVVVSGTVNGGTVWKTNFKGTNSIDSAPMPWYQMLDSSDLAAAYQPIKQDSGWVNITPTAGDAPFATAAATVLRYRKIDNRVELQVQRDSTASFAPADANFAPDINVFAAGIIPTAIRNPAGQPNPVATARFNDAPVSVVMTAAGAILMVGGVARTYASGSTLYATASWYLD